VQRPGAVGQQLARDRDAARMGRRRVAQGPCQGAQEVGVLAHGRGVDQRRARVAPGEQRPDRVGQGGSRARRAQPGGAGRERAAALRVGAGAAPGAARPGAPARPEAGGKGELVRLSPP
jgi:hypothetical protein